MLKVNGDPVDPDYEVIDSEDRHRSVGVTDEGRCLVEVWTIRDGNVRDVTGVSATASIGKFFPERFR